MINGPEPVFNQYPSNPEKYESFTIYSAWAFIKYYLQHKGPPLRRKKASAPPKAGISDYTYPIKTAKFYLGSHFGNSGHW
jgi:hypothetical protein